MYQCFLREIMHITNKDNAEKIVSEHGETIYELATPASGDMRFHSVVYVEIEPLKSSKKHYHPSVEECYYILSGEAMIELNEQQKNLRAGDLVAIPVGVRHKITNLSDKQKLKFIATCATPWTPDCSIFLE